MLLRAVFVALYRLKDNETLPSFFQLSLIMCLVLEQQELFLLSNSIPPGSHVNVHPCWNLCPYEGLVIAHDW
jgi:hypothetical protein